MVRKRKLSGEKQFDLIFMDMLMPVMDGLEASAKILELDLDIPVIAMTANVMHDDKEAYKEIGLHDCLGKPFTSRELWHCLLKYLKPVPQEGKNMQLQDNILLEADLIFLKALQQYFVQNNQGKYEKIVKTLDAGDIKLAHRLVHNIKSNASQLGKENLRQAAADIERCLKDGKNLVTEEQLKILETELNLVLAESATELDE
jgi:CheY-like chemotaxis protein